MNHSPDVEPKASEPMTPGETASVRRDDAQGRRILGKSFSFWRTAAAAGLAAAGLGAFRWQGPRIDSPGIIVYLFFFAALLIAGPARKIEYPAKRDRWLLRLTSSGIVIVPIASILTSLEREAITLTTPVWLLVPVLAIFGWRLRQHDSDLPALTLMFVAFFRILLNFQDKSFQTAELTWWLVTLLWIVIVYFASTHEEHAARTSAPLLAGVFWLVCTIGSLSIAEFRQPLMEFNRFDQQAASEMIAQKPIFGWGIGSFPAVMQEYSLRPPAAGSFTTPGYLRAASEFGLLPLLMMTVGGVGAAISLVRRRVWNRGRYIAAGAIGFWIIAWFSSRSEYYSPLLVVSLLAAPAIGQPRLLRDGNGNALIPGYATSPWLMALLFTLIPALLFPFAQWRYQQNYRKAPLSAGSFLSGWSYPMKRRALTIRDRAPEISQFADPAVYLEPVVKDWVRIAPHDEWAHVERIRWAYRALPPTEAERVAREAHARLPWSPTITAWVVRIQREQGRVNEAIEFLESVAEEHGPLHPSMLQRLRSLKIQRMQMEMMNNGTGN